MEVHSSLLDELLEKCRQVQASDLHLSADEMPFVRVHGRLQPLGSERLSAAAVEQLAYDMMLPRQRAVFDDHLTLDLAYAPQLHERYRINVYRERGRVAVAIRRLENRFREFSEWGLPPQLAQLAELRDGLILVTGPTGSGKTTTLATMIHQINQSRACHIVTIEDPVEYVHQNHRSLVHQRELHADVPSFAQAVRASLREDPDVILVGEMRDVETIQAAVTAAETGHLVFSTLHTGDAVGALDRIIGVFSGDEQQSIRQQLSMVLRAVIAQRLLPTVDGGGRVPVVEILQVTTAVAHLIRSGKPQQIYSTIEAGMSQGMQTMEQALVDLVRSGKVDVADAKLLARDPRLFEERMRYFDGNNGTPGRSSTYARTTNT